MEKERQKEKQRKRKEEEALSFLLSISAQLDEGPLGYQLSWAERRSRSLPSPWLFPLQASAEQADSSHPPEPFPEVSRDCSEGPEDQAGE